MDPNALKAAHLVERLERLARGRAEERLNPAQWETLRYFASANRFSRTPAAAAEYLASTRGTVSRTIASLESNGYLARTGSPVDGRSVVISLTRKAEDALSRDPILDLASDIEHALGGEARRLVKNLSAVLMKVVLRNRRRPFGMCSTCRHFRRSANPDSKLPHHCALLDEPLSDLDARSICLEQETAA